MAASGGLVQSMSSMMVAGVTPCALSPVMLKRVPSPDPILKALDPELDDSSDASVEREF